MKKQQFKPNQKRRRRRVQRPNERTIPTIRYVYLFSLMMMVIGFIYGTIFYNQYGSLISTDYLNEVILNDYFSRDRSIWALLSLFMKEFSYFFIVWFLSFTIIGIIIIVFILFFVGFLFGFTMWYFIAVYGYQGIYLTLLFTFPKNLILIPYTIYFTTQSMMQALRLLNGFYRNQNRNHMQSIIKQSINLLFFTIGILIVYVLVEAIFFNLIGEELRMHL